MVDTIYSQLINIVGTPPTGYEYLLYTASCICMLFITWSMLKILNSLFKWISGQR